MSSRTRVLSAFREIHRTCQSVFAGDRRALRASRWKINTEFKRFKDEAVPKKIDDHIQWARDASRLLKVTTLQGEPRNRASYEKHLEENRNYSGNNRSFNHKPFGDRYAKPWERNTWRRNANFDESSFDHDPYVDRSRGQHFRGQQHRKKWERNAYHDDSSFDSDPYEDPTMQRRHGNNWRSTTYYDDDSMFDEESYGDVDRRQHKKKSRSIDSANFDLWRMTGKKR